jgi:hypothetical protein
MGSRIPDPREELRALALSVGVSHEGLAAVAVEAGIPPTRLTDAVDGVGQLSINDLSRCRDILERRLLARAVAAAGARNNAAHYVPGQSKPTTRQAVRP